MEKSVNNVVSVDTLIENLEQEAITIEKAVSVIGFYFGFLFKFYYIFQKYL